MFLPAGGAKRNLPVLLLLTGRFFFFCPAGATRWTDQGEIWQGGPLLPAKFHLDRLGVWVYGTQNFEKILILPILLHLRAGLLHDSYKIYYVYAHPHSIHNSDKFGCILINYKIINNLPRWGVFSQNFGNP